MRLQLASYPIPVVVVAMMVYVATRVEPIAADAHTTTSQRKLQVPTQTLNYRANYTADFQALRDTFCIGESPVIQVTCFGKNMTILSTSNETITCTPKSISSTANGTTYVCTNTCIENSDCATIYLANTNGKSTDGPFGSIQFMCEGNDIAEVDAAMEYIGDNGSCLSVFDGASTRNLHIGRLGVSCPVSVGSTTRQYVYDDTYFECDSADTLPFDGFGDEPVGDLYTCEVGKDCNGEACNITFTNLVINAYVPEFYNTCVEALVPITTIPTPAPAPIASSDLEVTVKFQALWGNLFSSDTVTSPVCNAGTNSTLIITCENDARIAWVDDSTDFTSFCTSFEENKLRCTEAVSEMTNRLTNIFFECKGPKLPSARVTYESAAASCASNSEVATIRHAVSLGIFCDVPPTGELYYYGDIFIECADDSYDFSLPFSQYGTDGIRHLCSTSASFPISSSSTDTQLIPEVSIITDDYWLTNAIDGCFQINPTTPTVTTPIAAPTTAPVQAPLAPTLPPTLTTNAPSKQASVPTVLPPVVAPVTPRDIPPTTETSSNSSIPIGAVVGGIGGGIAVAALIFGLIIYQKRNSSSRPSDDGPKQQQLHYTTGNDASAYGHNSTSTPPTFNEHHSYTDTLSNAGTITTNATTGGALHQQQQQSPHYNATPPVVPLSTTPPGSATASTPYHVEYKDQTRSVIAPPSSSQQQQQQHSSYSSTSSSTPAPVVVVQPYQEVIPLAVALDVSATSKGSHGCSKEPPGRRMEEP